MRGNTTTKVLKYALLPGIIPQAKRLFTSGFGYVAFLIANIYAMVRLLPATHPYLIPENIGKFGIRHVVAEAANRLILKKENWDQILIFAIMLTGIVLLAAQIGLIIFSLIFQPAMAYSYFVTPLPSGQNAAYTSDIAFILLDRVLGIPGFFCAGTGAGKVCTEILAGGRWPFHIALQSMFQFYSLGLLVVAVLIVLYYVVIVVGETAISGSPFGQRFQNIWVPVRLVVALALLTPLPIQSKMPGSNANSEIITGLNSGQYIVLIAARYGSSFATNAWHTFINTVRENGGGSSDDSGNTPIGQSNLLAKPNMPTLAPLIEFMSLVHACAYQEWRLDHTISHSTSLGAGGGGGPGSAIATNPKTVGPPPAENFYIKPFIMKRAFPWMVDNDKDLHKEQRQIVGADMKYTDAVNFYNYGDIIIRFGRFKPAEQSADYNDLRLKPHKTFEKYVGGIEPTCGEVRIKISDLSQLGQGKKYGGADMMQNFYFDLIKRLWYGGAAQMEAYEKKIGQESANTLKDISQRSMEIKMNEGTDLTCYLGKNNSSLPQGKDCGKGLNEELRLQIVSDYDAWLFGVAQEAWEKYNEEGIDAQIAPEVADRGWAGAGIWYNTISKINGAFMNAVSLYPAPKSYPLIMEKTRIEKKMRDANVSDCSQFAPNLNSQGVSIKLTSIVNDDIKKAGNLAKFYDEYWKCGKASHYSEKMATSSLFESAITLIFGTQGLFDMKSGANAGLHPLAQLSALGKGLVDSAITNVASASGIAFLGGPLGILGEFVGKIASIASKILGSTAFIGLTAGVMLYYVLPFMPFLYFFFAVAAWVKSLFEAMVGIPLWALAHLRLDGEGLPGQSASDGYFYIFDIFLRPIIIVFGLVAAMIIFSAQIRVLNFIWEIVVDNLTGAESGILNASTTFESPEEIAILEDTADNIGLSFNVNVSRQPVDKLFFTIIYAVIVYMMAVASFKLINSIPQSIMRWMGSSIASFSDQANQENPLEGLKQYAVLGGMTVGQKTVGAVQGAASQGGATLRKILDGVKGN